MNIRMVHNARSGRKEPQILCDSCQDPIEDLNLAIATWERDSQLPSDVIVVHKGTCNRLVDPPLAWPFAELTRFLEILHEKGVEAQQERDHSTEYQQKVRRLLVKQGLRTREQAAAGN